MCSLISFVFSSTPCSTVWVCSPRRIRITPSTASSTLLKPNSPSRGACPIVTSPMSRMRTGTPFCVAHDDARDIRLVANQPQPAHVVELAALRIKSAAGIRVVDSKLRHHLRHGDVIAVQARRIEKHLILHHCAAESGIVRHASCTCLYCRSITQSSYVLSSFGERSGLSST